MGEMRLIEAVREGLREEMERDSSVFLIGQDIGVNGGVFRVTEGLQAEFGIDRVIDAPLAESGLVGVAIGAALNGMRPVVEIQFADFIFPAFNQLVSEA
ncbi:MAG: alpha-ketoacid dehydrogenase subunit beta, partial [Chloroflexota bacterium]|nr:alpha-ketoacid dehydrogenase subunit beta [Chloroflexota bacterium]